MLTRSKFKAIMAPIVAAKRKRAEERAQELQAAKKAKVAKKAKQLVEKRRLTTRQKAVQAATADLAPSQRTIGRTDVTEKSTVPSQPNKQPAEQQMTAQEAKTLDSHCFDC